MRERMGSGGPRGLQILRSGASRVRGGFDSHAFPPLFLAALLGAALLLPSTRATAAPAAPVSPVTSPAPLVRDSATVAPEGAAARTEAAPATAPAAAADADTAAARRKLRWSEQPRMVMFRSLLVPGWGQLHNHAWFKAAIVAGLEGWLIGSIAEDQSRLGGLLDNVNRLRTGSDQAALDRAINEYNDRLNRSVSNQWLLGGVLAYALVDAYVDAHFRTFDVDFRTDPALPSDGAPEGSPSGGGKGTAARLSLRWHF